jgi:NLI interacting factor-like phosphatase
MSRVGHYVKDLALLGRELAQTIIIDNSPMSYIFHPENAIDCGSFIDDLNDVEMWQVRFARAARLGATSAMRCAALNYIVNDCSPNDPWQLVICILFTFPSSWQIF